MPRIFNTAALKERRKELRNNQTLAEKTLRNDFYLKNIVYEIEKVIKLVWDSEKG